MTAEDAQGPGQSDGSAACNQLGRRTASAGRGPQTLQSEGQLKLLLRGGPEEQALMPIRRLENN